MMTITRAATNYVYPTTKEKEILTSPSYLIKFVADDAKNVRYCSSTDSSPAIDRYQKLTIVETNTPTPLTNQIKLDMSKSWKYFIYEISAANLAALTSYTNAEVGLTEVERGRVRVRDSSSTQLNVYNGYQTTYNVYG